MGVASQEKLEKGAKIWFWCMGAAAVALTMWLYRTDRYLSENDGELVKGEVLRNLRTAQSSFGTTHYDNRQGAYAESSAGLNVEMANIKPQVPILEVDEEVLVKVSPSGISPSGVSVEEEAIEHP